MAETGADIDNLLREWAPVSDLLNKIPTKTQNGLFNHEVCLTCVDILPEYIAVGTNLGLVYWYDRKKEDLQRLRCENPNVRITTIKVISTVDYMVACGNCDGQISIFQIPKTHPDTLPESLKPKSKQVERYTVSELHTSAITSLEWSKNGMKLFSGDKNGLIVLTEIDFYMHLSKSVDILNEAYEVVQLSYCQQHLLVSTTYRSIVCKKEDKWKVCQVGKKDRKTLGKLGAVFCRNSLKPKDLVIYCTRPGLRIWISDLQGTVHKTLLFKDLLNKECYEVPLINPITGYAKKLKPLREATFGVLLPFGENLLVTYSSEVIYILDPISLIVIAMISHLRRILSVATCKDEMFILEGERSLLRISFKPEPALSDTTSNAIPTASTFLPLTNSLRDLSNKIQTSSIISALPPLFETATSHEFNVQTDSTTVISAEEALELPPVRKLPTKISLKITDQTHRARNNSSTVSTGFECKDIVRESAKKWEVFDKISEEEFDDHILFKHRRKRRNKLIENDMTTSASSLSSNSSDERDGGQLNRPCLLNVSTVGTLQPDLRSPDSILHDIESKEKILADILNLDKIQFSKFENDKSTECKLLENPLNFTLNSQLLLPIKQTNITLNGSDSKIVEQNKVNDKPTEQPNDVTKNTIGSSHYFQQNTTANFQKAEQKSQNDTMPMSYGPPSGSSNPNSIDPPACLVVPNVWKLQEITINNQDTNETSDNSLCDWEII
ncbi:uncharacterized protein CBL_02580 [Carabus blaptoides fortunei]